jgi:hypothetical protein
MAALAAVTHWAIQLALPEEERAPNLSTLWGAKGGTLALRHTLREDVKQVGQENK